MWRWRSHYSCRIVEALEKLETALAALEERLEGREYLVNGFSLADIAHAGNLSGYAGLRRGAG